jgi:nitrate/TMAO reductase-like tetraheme cytochrome c subunit
MGVIPPPYLLALFQPPQDTAALQRFAEGVPHSPPPIPGGITAVMRAIFNAPLWLWILALLVLGAAAFWIARLLWRNRHRMWTWFRTQERPVKLTIAAGFLLLLGVVGWAGLTSQRYMQHENAFCVGCHVMEGPWNKFAVDAGKHSKLQCHDCHQQSLYASTRQLVLWLADRPEEIAMHAPVANARCEACHATGDTAKWSRVKETAGHRTHLESDSTALKDVRCVTCHGVEVHVFQPASKTCGQSGCHEQLEVKLGGMAQQTTLHCVQCHEFTAEVPLLATRDSAAGTLRPGEGQCLACHEMRRLLEEFDVVAEPHRAVCGTCHNPHTQETPQAAGRTCASGQCHSNWGSIPFHVGATHRRVVERCLACHEPHAARADASDCVGCHQKITSRFGTLRLRPPLPFDTLRALRQSPEPPPRPPGGPSALHDETESPPDEVPIAWASFPLSSQAAADTFPHPRHRRLACITCHLTGSGHGRLTFERPRGCQICHHQRPQQTDCATCHRESGRSTPLARTIAIAVRDSAPRSRTVRFAHPTHRELRCVECHTEPVSLEPAGEVLACRACHGDHHAAGRSCATCHSGEQLRTAHRRDLAASHQACDACHTATTVARLTPDRTFCLTCHQPQSEHYPRGQCATCHFLKEPAELRAALLSRTRG